MNTATSQDRKTREGGPSNVDLSPKNAVNQPKTPMSEEGGGLTFNSIAKVLDFLAVAFMFYMLILLGGIGL